MLAYIAEISTKPDVPASIRALPVRRAQGPTRTSEGGDASGSVEKRNFPMEVAGSPKRESRTTPLSPRRYKLQVTIAQGARDKLAELQDLLSHQIPDGDAAAVIERALGAQRRQHPTPMQGPQSIRSGTGVRRAFHGEAPAVSVAESAG